MAALQTPGPHRCRKPEFRAVGRSSTSSYVSPHWGLRPSLNGALKIIAAIDHPPAMSRSSTISACPPERLPTP
ncbi:MAG: hypothetical protein ACREXK_14875, partial [Gammaproteobacteria bacterium]